jgi:predicted glycoside hydrolase/deacetylase ChbG (UPF0249 family)
MKRLIVNADDLGADESRNAGIFEAIEAGIVTSASILANGPAFEDTLRRIRFSSRKEISYGIHLNLSEGKSLIRNLPLLAGPDGYFPGKFRAHRLFEQRGNNDLEEEIYRETAAQIEALLNAGIHVTHLDGHQHIQIFPAVIESAIQVAEAFGIPWIRLPDESPERHLSSGSLDTKALLYGRFASAARPYIEKSKLRTTDHFRGLYLKGRLRLSLLKNTLERLPDGTTELMVHPGRAPSGESRGTFSSFSTPERENELMALVGEEFRDTLIEYGISLIPFPEVNT